MATSGTLTGSSWKTYAYSSSLTGYSNIQLTWSATQNISANTNTISWTLKFLNRNGSSSGSGLGTGYTRTVTDWTVRVGTSSSSYTTYSSSSSTVAYNGQTLKSGTTTLSANNDGTCNVYVYIIAHIGGTGTSNQTTNNSTTALDQIPRSSSIALSGNVTMGKTYTNNIVVTQQSSSYYTAVYYSYPDITGYTSDTLIGRNGGSSTFNLSWSPVDVSSLAGNAETVTAQLKVITYSDAYTTELTTTTQTTEVYVPFDAVAMSLWKDGNGNFGARFGAPAVSSGFVLTQQMFDDGNLRELIRPVVAWTNSDSTATFAGQTITLDVSMANYEYYEIIYRQVTSGDVFISTGKIPVGEDCRMQSIAIVTSGTTGLRARQRDAVYTSATQFTFSDGAQYTHNASSSTGSVSASTNTINIPHMILLY